MIANLEATVGTPGAYLLRVGDGVEPHNDRRGEWPDPAGARGV